MWIKFKLLLRRIAIAAGAVVIVAAIALGAFRLFAAGLPSYKADLQAWVQDELNLYVEYDGLDLRLGFSGPELVFYDVALTSEEFDQPFVLARSANVTLDPMVLFFERQFTPTRLVFDGIRITVQRSMDGTFSVAGAPQNELSQASFAFEIPEEVQLEVRNSEVVYFDESLGIAWPFTDVTVAVEQEFRSVSLSVTADPPEEWGERLTASVDGIISAGADMSDDWRAFVSVRKADIATIAQLWPGAPVASAVGDISVWLHSDEGELVSALADINVSNLVLPWGTQSSQYDRIALTAEWSRNGRVSQLSLNDVIVEGPDVAWPRNGSTTIDWTQGGGPVELRTDYFRFDDLLPFVAVLPESELQKSWLSMEPRGTVEDLALSLRSLEQRDFTLQSQFADISVNNWYGFEMLSGISGEVRADTDGGSLRLSSEQSSVEYPSVLGLPIDVSRLSGLILWRQGRDAIRIVSDDLAFATLGADVSASIELSVPLDGSAPSLELETEIGSIDMADIMPLVTASKMPTTAAQWLDRALGVGRIDSTQVSFFGALDAFPFDDGGGELRIVADVSGGAVDYIAGWPIAEGFDGQVEFVNLGFSATGRAQVLGNVSENVTVQMGDFRKPELSIRADTEGPFQELLDFLLGAPKIAAYLGPQYARLSAPEGRARVKLALDIPLPLVDLEALGLQADLEIVDGTLAFAGFGPQASDISGLLALRGGSIQGENIQGTFLDGPATAHVETPGDPAYRARLIVSGEVTADAVVAAFNLPHAEHLAGQTLWEGSLLLPSMDPDGGRRPSPVQINVDTNLSGIAMRFPEPFTKAPGEATNLHLSFGFDSADLMRVDGNLGANRHFSGEYRNTGGAFAFERGRLRFGSQSSESLPVRGFSVDGDLARLNLDEWLRLPGSVDVAGSYANLAGVELNVADFTVFDQPLGQMAISVQPHQTGARVSVDSELVAGLVELPADLSARQPITANLDRLFIQMGRQVEAERIDPRDLPGLELDIDDFRIGARHLGAFKADVQPDPLGLRLVSFSSLTESFAADGSGAWLVGDQGVQSRLAVSLNSNDVAASLEEFGLDPLISGRSAELTASLRWPDGPNSQWMNHVNGDIALRVTDGSMLDIEPGAGRIVGLMSIVALPRRLALDFRDVFNRGFVFDEISADFAITDGDAFTDNLMLSGPAAEIGVVGRTGLRDHDFQQQAIVTAEPGNMLPTVGGLIGGPGVGAALLIFTRIFKKQLKGIGRASYCITGGWEEPSVERLTPEQIENGQICAELPPNWVTSAEMPIIE